MVLWKCDYYYYTAPVAEQSISISLSVCLCICLYVCLSICEHICGTAGPIFTKYFMHIPCGRGSVLLWRRCDALVLVLMDDITFGRNGPYGDVWKAESQPTTTSGVSISGQSLMSTNALLLLLLLDSLLTKSKLQSASGHGVTYNVVLRD